MEQYVQEPAMESRLNQEGISLSNWKSKLPTIHEAEDNSSGGMDCNICLDLVQDPVVTFCGHLYCWPCIYKWIHFQTVPTGMSEHQQQPQCPVCKTEVSKETLIPLYGRGLTTPKSSSDGKGPQLGIVIPQRPPSPRCDGGLHLQTIPSPTTTTITSRAVPQLQPRTHGNRHQSQRYLFSGNDMDSPTLSLSPNSDAGTTSLSTNMVHHPIAGMLTDMAFARIFGISEAPLHSHANTYRLMDRSTPRMRRQLMRTERSLSRVCFFLCCCMIVCLLLF